MLEIAIGLALVLVVVIAPPLRRMAMSMFGLLAIIAVGAAAFAALVWALFESKPLIVGTGPTPVQGTPASEKGAAETIETLDADLASALASEEEQRLKEEQKLKDEQRKEEQRRLEEEKKRLSGLAARARVVLEQDRKLAAQAASFPLPIGVGGGFGDMIAVRIPAWRDRDVAARQAESIRTWLQSIGLGPEETESIVTAKAWGALYDMWVAENPGAGPPRPRLAEPEAVPSPPEPEPSPRVEIAQEPELLEPQPSPSREVARRPPPRSRAMPSAPPPRRAPPRRPRVEREPGPFGY